MGFRFCGFFAVAFLLISCNDDSEKRSMENVREVKKQQTVFATVNKAWVFNTDPITPASEDLVSSWPQWRNLLKELSQKPNTSIGAFRKKAKTLSERAKALESFIPVRFNKPEIKSRIAVLETKINSLNLFINLNDVPVEKVVAQIGGINTELISLQRQMEEIVRRSEIPKEVGESDMIKMLDTSRAIPNLPKKTPKVE